MKENGNKPSGQSAGALMAEATGFMKSRVILTAAELDLFTRLDEKPCGAGELAEAKQLDARATTRILDALAALGMLEKNGGVYKPSETGAFYSSRHPQSVLPMLLHMNRMWTNWSHLTDAVKHGEDTEAEPGLHMGGEQGWKAFIGAMHVIGKPMSMMIADIYDTGPFKRLLDIGGASGTYSIAFLRRNPALTAVIFDLEHIIPMARQRITAEKLLDRVDFAAGDFYTDELPGGCDLALLSAIIHQNSPEANVALYQKIFKALEPGGTLLIRDHIMEPDRVTPHAGAMFAINMLVLRRGGDTYTFDEIRSGLEQAGFTDVKLVRSGEMMDGLVQGTKPAGSA